MFNFSKILSFKEEKKKKISQTQQNENNNTDTVWIKCSGCNALMYSKEIQKQHFVCPKCNYHMRMPVMQRIELLSDEGSFKECDDDLRANDPLNFVDKVSYKKRLETSYKKTSRHSSVVSGECKMNGLDIQLVVFDFSFMGGSLGSVEGEKILRAINRSIEKKQPLIIVSSSGGARMQESTFSLMQMAKTSAGLKKLDSHKIPYISLLVDPTMGGVSASFATLGDFIIAEPGAQIGFAGKRVIEQTIGSSLPDTFQKAEFLLQKGAIDMIVKRADLKDKIHTLLTLLHREEK